MLQSARPPGLAGPSHQTYTHSVRAHTLTKASACVSHSKGAGFLKNQSRITLIRCSNEPPPLCFLTPPTSPQLPSQHASPARLSESRGGTTGQTYHTLPHPSSYGIAHSSSPTWGPLEPPSTPKPWSMSCLRPAPPLRPSAALAQKEVLYIRYLKNLKIS